MGYILFDDKYLFSLELLSIMINYDDDSTAIHIEFCTKDNVFETIQLNYSDKELLKKDWSSIIYHLNSTGNGVLRIVLPTSVNYYP